MAKLPKTLDARYDDTRGVWSLRVPFALPGPVLERARAFVLKINQDRWRSAGPGDKKDYLGRACRALVEGRFEQVIVGQEAVCFQSTERERPERSIFIPGGAS